MDPHKHPTPQTHWRSSSLNDLPLELIHYLFTKLDLPSLFHVAQVCKKWHTLSSEDIFWFPHLKTCKKDIGAIIVGKNKTLRGKNAKQAFLFYRERDNNTTIHQFAHNVLCTHFGPMAVNEALREVINSTSHVSKPINKEQGYEFVALFEGVEFKFFLKDFTAHRSFYTRTVNYGIIMILFDWEHPKSFLALENVWDYILQTRVKPTPIILLGYKHDAVFTITKFKSTTTSVSAIKSLKPDSKVISRKDLFSEINEQTPMLSLDGDSELDRMESGDRNAITEAQVLSFAEKIGAHCYIEQDVKSLAQVRNLIEEIIKEYLEKTEKEMKTNKYIQRVEERQRGHAYCCHILEAILGAIIGQLLVPILVCLCAILFIPFTWFEGTACILRSSKSICGKIFVFPGLFIAPVVVGLLILLPSLGFTAILCGTIIGGYAFYNRGTCNGMYFLLFGAPKLVLEFACWHLLGNYVCCFPREEMPEDHFKINSSA